MRQLSIINLELHFLPKRVKNVEKRPDFSIFIFTPQNMTLKKTIRKWM